MIDRRYRTGDGAIIVAALGLMFFTFREYRGFTSISGPVEVVSGSSPIAAAARIETTKSYLLTHPEDFNAWADLGIACYQKGPDSYAEGLNALDKARKLGATGDALFWYAGVMFQGLGLPEYAISELEKYRRHYPEHRETRARLANLYLQEKRIDEAWALYDTLRKENPKDPVILYNYAIVAKEKGKWEEAYSALTALHQTNQSLPADDGVLEKEIKTHMDESIGKKP